MRFPKDNVSLSHHFFMQEPSKVRFTVGGFTLIELMIVVAIVGIMVSVAVPIFADHRARAHDSSAHADARNMISVFVVSKE